MTAFSPESYAKLLVGLTDRDLDDIAQEISEVYKLSFAASRHIVDGAVESNVRRLDRWAVEEEHYNPEED